MVGNCEVREGFPAQMNKGKKFLCGSCDFWDTSVRASRKIDHETAASFDELCMTHRRISVLFC